MLILATVFAAIIIVVEVVLYRQAKGLPPVPVDSDA